MCSKNISFFPWFLASVAAQNLGYFDFSVAQSSRRAHRRVPLLGSHLTVVTSTAIMIMLLTAAAGSLWLGWGGAPLQSGQVGRPHNTGALHSARATAAD